MLGFFKKISSKVKEFTEKEVENYNSVLFTTRRLTGSIKEITC
jgi:hypothetical protein